MAEPDKMPRRKQYARRWPHSLQQEILDALDESRCCGIEFLGGGRGVVSAEQTPETVARFEHAGWERIGYAMWRLPEGVYDMREAVRFVAAKKGKIRPDGTVDKAFSVTFTVAVRSLCERQELICDAPDLPNKGHRRFIRRNLDLWPGFGTARPLQRLIMEKLDESREAQILAAGTEGRVFGSGMHRVALQLYLDASWERIDFNRWRAPHHVYDMRALHRYLQTVSQHSSNEFSRAIRELCESGALISEAPDLPKLKQRRFVKKWNEV